MKNEPRNVKGSPAVRCSDLVRQHNQSESEAACSGPDIAGLPSSAYESGRLTFSGLMMTPVTCRISSRNWFRDRTPQFRRWGKSVLRRWQSAGYPSLGAWPPEKVGLYVLDYALGVMCAVLSNDKAHRPMPGDEHRKETK